jgi:hypothetical protein
MQMMKFSYITNNLVEGCEKSAGPCRRNDEHPFQLAGTSHAVILTNIMYMCSTITLLHHCYSTGSLGGTRVVRRLCRHDDEHAHHTVASLNLENRFSLCTYTFTTKLHKLVVTSYCTRPVTVIDISFCIPC